MFYDSDESEEIVELCLGYKDYLEILNDPYFYLEPLDKIFYQQIGRTCNKVYQNFKLLNREVQLNISLNDLNNNISFEKNKFDSLDLDYFIPAFSYIKKLILKQNSNNQIYSINKFYLKKNKYLFLIREKSNICDSVDYDNCEEIDHKGRTILNPPFHRIERWSTFYLVNAYEINPNMSKDKILEFLNNQQN